MQSAEDQSVAEAKKDKDEEKAEEKGGGGKGASVLILIMVGINLLAVAGIGVYLVLFNKPAAAAPAAPPEEKKGGKIGQLVEMQTVVANLSDTESSRYIKVTPFLDVGTKEQNKIDIEKYMVPIRNEMLIYFSDIAVKDTLGSGAKKEMQEALKKRLNKVIGKKMIRAVFFTEFVVQ